MRIVVDMQGAQTGSRFRGIGRYTLSLALAMARNRGEHEILLALNGQFADTVEPIRAAFDGLIPQEDIRVWTAPGPVMEAEPSNNRRREVAERIREAFLASLNPDFVVVSSLFEGLGDDAVASVGILDRDTPTATILYDLIPLINPDVHFRTSKLHQEYYARKIASLERSHLLLAISDSARQEAIDALDYPAQNIVNISCASDDSFRTLDLTEEQKKHLFDKYGILRPFVMYTGAAADERKNLFRLIEAYSHLPRSIRRKHQLVIIGKVPEYYATQLAKSAKRYGLLSGEILVVGYVEDEDLVRLYNSCVLFAFPSLHEGFGIPPLEAMLCGAPVIAANATSLPEVIGRSDALFDPNSVASISKKLEEALTDEAFRASLIAHGKVQARKFSWDESAKRTLTALQDFAPARAARIDSALHVDKTSIFRKLRKKILLIKLDHMGDFVLAIPAITKIRARYPYASIDIVLGGWNAAIASSLKIFDNIYTFNYFKKKSSELPSTTRSEFIEALGKLADYDIAIDLRRQPETRFLLVETQAKMKVGYQTYDPAINAKLDIDIPVQPDVSFKKTILNSTSTAKQLLELVDALPDDVNDFISLPEISERTISDKTSIAVFPLAGSNAREWDKCNYTALVELLQRDVQIHSINIYFGSAEESAGFDFKASEKLNIHVGLDFQELARSVSSNAICVANNSFGAHFGSYLGLTVIAIYSGHETSDEWAPVFGDSYVVHTAAPCSPCHQGKRSDCTYRLSCLNDISVAFVHERIMEAVNSINRQHSGARGETAETISLNKGRRDVVEELIASIADSMQVRDLQEYASIAAAISRNHPPHARLKQLFVDISEIVRSDSGTGIQRVVRSIVAELLASPPKGYKVETVYAPPGQQGYRYAREYTSRLLGGTGSGSDDLVEAYNGDLFLGLDLHYPVISVQKAQLLDWHRSGVKIYFVVYDLLPLLLSHRFPDDAQVTHRAWLDSISQFDGALCISRAVADDFCHWMQAFGTKRKRPFSVNWFHLGADFGNALATKGMPDGADPVLAAITSRPTFLMVGTLEPRKGHSQVLDAFEHLWREGVGANLVIVGKNGWMVESLAEKLRGHDKNGECLFWLEGTTDEFLQEIYASSACLIVASEGEGFGLPLIEAAQHKLPVIARDLPVFREVAGEHAFYFADDNAPEVVAETVLKWLALHRAGETPRSDAMQWQTWKVSGQELLSAMLNNEPYCTWLPDGRLCYWGNDPRLDTQVGARFGRSMRTTGQEGYLLHGPYIPLQAGRYRIVWHGSATQWTGREWLDVVFDQGRRSILRDQLANLNAGPWQYRAEFVLDAGVVDIGFRIHVDEATELTVDGIEVTPLDNSDIESNIASSGESASQSGASAGKRLSNSVPVESDTGLPSG